MEISNIKDSFLVLLSAGALYSGFALNTINRRAQWVTEFRREVAYFIFLVIEVQKDTSLLKEIRKSRALIELYLDNENKLHNKFKKVSVEISDLFNPKHSTPYQKEDFNPLISNLAELSKMIIKEKQKFQIW